MYEQFLFGGRAVTSVDHGGRMILPAFVTEVLERRGSSRTIWLGVHERDSCLHAYDQSYHRTLFAEIERRRLSDEAAGRTAADHHSRLRRAFGFVEQSPIADDGAIILPPLLRRKAMIKRAALIVGVGGSFEIWSPRVAREATDPLVRELADLRGPATSPEEGMLAA
ncbi:MAG: hypothetical protein ACK4SZ_13225 [Allosphingosinicella sp.]|uniref:hypothetical protein n=1 Tax=Allosphingosinicella sp. TaxID=2823234 RepID=UPI0039436E54